MALQVWLPLTKDLRNQGLSNVTVTNNGATFNSAGKLGGCYSFGTGNSYITVDSTPLKTFTEFSFACWMKIISWNTSYSTVFAAKNSTSVGWANLIFSLLRFGSTSTLCFNVSSGSNYTTNSCRTNDLSLNTWYHITCTYKNGEIKLYQDGDVVSIYKTTVVPNFNSIVNLWIGKSNANSYQSNNLLNDVRIYDHCLSPMEVKELAKGLVLHYPLNRQGWGQENLITRSGNFVSIDGWTNNQNTTLSTENNELKVIINQTSSTPGIKSTNTIDLPAGTYTGSLLIKVENGNKNYINYPFYLATAGGTTAYGGAVTKREVRGDYIYEEATFTTTSAINGVIVYVLTSGPINGETWHLKWIKLEKGSIATPWCPNSADTLATTMGLNSTTEYDCSGFCNNGTRIGTFTWTSNTSKYAVSQVFNGTDNAIQTPSLPTMITDKNYTVAVWIYKTVIGSKGYQTIYGGPSGFEIEARNASANEAKFVPWNWGKPMASYELNEWNHCVFVHSDSDCKIYLNGEYIATGTAKASNPAGNYFIGAWNTATQQNFDGLMSDFRIYATALSAADVKSLYQNCVTIDPDGTIRGKIR